MTFEEAVHVAREKLERAGVEDASIEAEVLLRHVLNLTRAQLYADYDREMGPVQNQRYSRLLRRRLAGEPTAYITGVREFYGINFRVDRRVLIPRPESELLVEEAIRLSRTGASSFADIGTGSGAIAVSLAVNLPGAKVYAVDISADALEVTAFNCRRHGVENRVTLLHGDLLGPLPARVDVIIANLPYVRKSELSAVNTCGYEPRLALDGGLDGLDQVRRIIDQLAGRLNPGGRLLLEIGQGQADSVCRIARDDILGAGVDVLPDLAGIPRVVAVTV